MQAEFSQMRREIIEIPNAVDRLLRLGAADIRTAADALRARPPVFMTTVARGSSDHVTTYLKYCCEMLLGVPVVSVGPSIASIYKRPLHLRQSAILAVSQSGMSPDIVETARMARAGGALTIAITNHIDSPLAQGACHTVNLHAGQEQSVAATKTFVNSAVAGLWLLAEFAENDALVAAIGDLPDALEKAVGFDWPDLREGLNGRNSIFCLGRGPALGIANEAALKFKEVCRIHAEAFSSAEVLHGPVSIMETGFPVLAFAAGDDAEDALGQVADDLVGMGGAVFATTSKVSRARQLDVVRTGHALTDPLALIATVYAMVERTAVGRGIDPDTPRHLKKVTRTR
ncbi:MAG: SIS domain-containing protein [Jannaschia sp.]